MMVVDQLDCERDPLLLATLLLAMAHFLYNVTDCSGFMCIESLSRSGIGMLMLVTHVTLTNQIFLSCNNDKMHFVITFIVIGSM